MARLEDQLGVLSQPQPVDKRSTKLPDENASTKWHEAVERMLNHGNRRTDP